MPYDSGTAASQHDFLDRLRVFLAANGWTVDLWAADASSYSTYPGSASTEGQRLHAHLGGTHLHFRSATRATVFGWRDTYLSSDIVDGVRQYRSQFTGLACAVSTGFDAQAAWDAQPGVPFKPAGTPDETSGSALWLSGALPGYRMFLVNEPFLLVLALEVSVGVWRYLLLADIAKYGAWGGGLFCAGPIPQTVLSLRDANQLMDAQISTSYGYGGWCSVHGRGLSDGDWAAFAAYPQSKAGALYPVRVAVNPTRELDFYAFPPDVPLLASMPSGFTGIAPMVPIRLALSHGDGNCSLIGEIPGLRLTRMDAFMPGEVVTLSGARHMVLPCSTVEAGRFCPAFAIPYDGD
ncbi:hypothetical protein GGQ74_000072 [Desulfobaculum xiamenense]|uniref:Uncharacterized protein n=1 Tax=Desulfobaculum xiamenense TaxID=995050 RepID=A0A846QIZ0_9BACT|nr:hypothetical protein [Desulfobaculum xiamenense]NJB66432.1 hypothetical protein [Desulfobaculum xiamenense]